MARDKKKKDEEVAKKVEELTAQLARALADYDNLQKRVLKEKEEMAKSAAKRLIVKFLPVYDMLLAAQKHLEDTGIAITINSFEQVLADEGVEIIRPKEGDLFDASVCEAVEVEETDDKEKIGKIAEMVLPGFKFKDGPVIRYCKVKVFGVKN
ncbi:MAG: hypothetical protein KatS3mg088_187 [Patescibacteria group bacterium]|nr:MAG: hypothetical protein KatS3mg088_187 [Patescibacteria group bacterium]